MQPLPTTMSLCCFEAVARLGSFTRAAAELGITQGAVSKQVAALECLVGTSLFVGDRKRQTVLSAIGRAYFEGVRQYLGDIRLATTTAISQAGTDYRLRIGVPTSFGSRWLMPRIAKFHTENPGPRLEFAARISGTSDTALTDLDASIEFAAGPSNGNDWRLIMDWPIVAAAPPSIVREHRLAEADLRLATVLLHRSEKALWDAWSQRTGYSEGMGRVLIFDHYDMLFEAATRGMGAAFAPLCLMDDELRSGQLVRIAGICLQSAHRCYFVSRASERRPAVEAFSRWMSAEAERSQRLSRSPA